MLSDSYCQPYKDFLRLLDHLKAIATLPNPDRSTLQATFLEAQQQFQMRINPLDLEALDPAYLGKVRSVQTEINKELRLLGMDISFLQAAKQSITAQHRQKQMSDRIQKLMQYCEAVLGIYSATDLKPDEANE